MKANYDWRSRVPNLFQQSYPNSRLRVFDMNLRVLDSKELGNTTLPNIVMLLSQYMTFFIRAVLLQPRPTLFLGKQRVFQHNDTLDIKG